MTDDRNLKTIPPFLYGAAWKELGTQKLVVQALTAGFLGIDTANQRKHYFEEGVGLGIQEFLQNSKKSRTDLFLQTKFTFANGQDHRKPYNEFDSFANQVQSSCKSSLQHLQTDYIDSYILHGPFFATDIAEADLEVWQAMERLYQKGKVKFLGVSNVDLKQLEELYKLANIKPSFVQNRCFANTSWDQQIRNFCNKHSIIYQGFSLLTANQRELLNPLMPILSKKYHATIPQIIFRFAIQIGILPLTGTTSQEHMHNDLNLDNFELSGTELSQIEKISTY